MSAIASVDPLQAAQEAIYFYLGAVEYLAEIPIVLVRKGNWEARLQESLSVLSIAKDGRRPGACLLVMLPTVNCEHPNVPGPQLEAVFTVRVIENPTLNLHEDGTGKSAESLALDVVANLHQWLVCAQMTALYALQDAIRPVEEKEGVGMIQYDVQVRARLGVAPKTRCASVALSVGGGNFTATCTTTGAEIWYTLDGSFPFRGQLGSLSSTALLYSTATPYTAGDLIRASAFASGNLQSHISELQT